MPARFAGAGGRCFLLSAFVRLCGLGLGIGSGQQGKADEKDKKTEEKKEEKKVKFNMIDKPWREVFKWLTEETGKPVIFVNAPTGTFSFVGPANREYTIPEVIDIINEGL